MTGSQVPPSFRLAYVPGVTPAKWVRIWNERLPGVPLALLPVPAAEAAGLLLDRGADAGLVRLPVDRTDLAAIPLYTETTVVVVPKDHFVAAADEVSAADLADEIVLSPLDDTLGWDRPPGRPARERPAGTADAVELVAAGREDGAQLRRRLVREGQGVPHRLGHLGERQAGQAAPPLVARAGGEPHRAVRPSRPRLAGRALGVLQAVAPGAAVSRTGRRRWPLEMKDRTGSSSSGEAARDRPGKRANRAGRAIAASIRASGAPRQ